MLPRHLNFPRLFLIATVHGRTNMSDLLSSDGSVNAMYIYAVHGPCHLNRLSTRDTLLLSSPGRKYFFLSNIGFCSRQHPGKTRFLLTQFQ
ncbi:hypothetical protein M514_20352 [Trichuris suis]|uniref:Uncharacterized protein n=1 Tax=Trichuris suis TaxID=68888 RepID=A0A085NDG5_9BILA|nr:hypothetical protein M514_20352 [Trichuris suis]